jgi:putative aldouronate transport system permease protein
VSTLQRTGLRPISGKKKEMAAKFKRSIPLLIMFIPAIIYFTVFKYVPLLGLQIAFKNYFLMDGIWKSPWCGLDNFRFLFSSGDTLLIIRNTFVLGLLGVIISFPFPILIALLFNEVRSKAYKSITQTFYYMPHFLSWVVVGGIFTGIFALNSGIVNNVTEKLFGFRYAYLYNNGSWMAVFLFARIWKEGGFNAIIYLAALTNIPPELYEAAALDGAGKFKRILHITLPSIIPTIITMLIINMGKVMEVGFDQVYTMQNAVVSSVSEVISTYVYKIGLERGQFSLTTAMGLFESLVSVTLVLITNAIAKRFDKGLW